MSASVVPPPPSIHSFPPDHYGQAATDVTAAMQSLVRPGAGNISCAECLATALGLSGARLPELRSIPSALGHRLIALRYLLENGAVWLRYFAWQKPLAKLDAGCVEQAPALYARLASARDTASDAGPLAQVMRSGSLSQLSEPMSDLDSAVAVELIALMSRFPELREQLRLRLKKEGPALLTDHPSLLDQLFLLTQDLRRFPATTTPVGQLRYVIVADKGEMGTRAVREALALGLVPIVLFSAQDDADALQVRVALEHGGFSIPLQGTFRETYANPVQIAERVLTFFKQTFPDDFESQLARAALYPGYGPLAENTAAIELFRRQGIAFIGPMQDVVERAGDKRKFRSLAEAIDPQRVTPGIVMDESDPEKIVQAIFRGAELGKFQFPGRLKAANGGGGRGQVVIPALDQVPQAVTKVLAEIRANGWDQGVMFEQNIPQTTHLEVQVLRDRFGKTLHFGMRDCTEQRASQKIQEEAPPCLLEAHPHLKAQMCAIAVQIADSVGYVGACTVELMYKDGHFYLLEMNTRIQVEHPVTEEAHRIRRGEELVALNLVQLQLRIAAGLPLDFDQEDIVCTHVAREFRINAESFKPDVKDPRDGKLGLFLPNAGVFDEMSVPDVRAVRAQLEAQGVRGIDELNVRFDCGFEVGDVLLNKDPTFGKLIVAVQVAESHRAEAFELLRRASICVLSLMRITGRQVLPNGKILADRPLETNLVDHVAVLETQMLKDHSRGGARLRHVNWLIEELRSRTA
jgi:acetyl/propionyl-CoA carboxylase alpha subunit